MANNIYQVRNECPKCSTMIDCPFTEDIKCTCTKHNCKNEFKKKLQGAIGITIKRNNENYLMYNEETCLNQEYTNYQDLEDDLNVLRQQQKIIEEGE